MIMKIGNALWATVVVAFHVAWAGAAVAQDPRTEPTRAVWERHLQAGFAGDLDGVMADFTESSVIITPEGVLAGEAAIRDFFEMALAGVTPDAMATVAVNAEFVHGNVVFFNVTVGAEGLTYHDVAVVEDDRITVLTNVAYPAE
jgi:hypothetical protein